MSDVIQLLPDSIANQIAAGEVVQRPASAVKELLENALDAKASFVQLIIKDAGKTFIQVIDDGTGMSETDARLSLERHATSKIRKAEDLFTLHTMGFRGEALASLAAVSQLEMKTRLAGRELGTWLVVEGSEVKKQEPIATGEGTTIIVKNLFYNIPARRNFLKSNPVEFNHIMDEFHRVTLSQPGIGFSFYHGDDLVHELPAAKLSQRIINLFGKNFKEQLVSCQESTDQIRVQGYIGKPEFSRKKRGEQFFFVNNRFIKSPFLNHAVISSFEGLIPDNTFPFYVLFIEIDPKHIDVNVHPTKTEIKFDDERSVYAVIRSAVRQAIGKNNLSPTLDFQNDVNILSKLSGVGQRGYSEVFFNERYGSSIQRSNLENWEKFFQGGKDSQLIQQNHPPQLLTFESSINEKEISTPPLVQFHNRYIFKQIKSGIMIFDQQAVHERILFEKFIKNIDHPSPESQQLLFPQTLSFPPHEFALILEMEKELFALGFQFEIFGKNTFLLNGVPALVAGKSEKQLFEGFIEQFKEYQSELTLPLKEVLSRSLARRSCIKPGQLLSLTEMQSLVDQLFTCHNPNYGPDGKPTFFLFELTKIESYFKPD